MTSYFADNAFSADPWAGLALLDGPEWVERRDSVRSDERFALALDPGFDVELLARDIGRFDLVKVAFPKFTDGRGYSMGWLLRSRFGYGGQMRAVGDVLFDEMQLMYRCGFDAFEITDPATSALLRSGRRPGTFDRFYQPGLDREVPVGTRPWVRRSAGSAGTSA